MPWIPLYLAGSDATNVLAMLICVEEIGFLVADGPKRWKAITSLPTLPGDGRTGLWHIPSGPLRLLARDKRRDETIHDPFSGWNERRTGADPTTPYFGAGHPGVIWLNVRLVPKERDSVGGMSSFEWIGNRYSLIGNPATKMTELWWKSLRRRIQMVASEVTLQRLSSSFRPVTLAYPTAHYVYEQ